MAYISFVDISTVDIYPAAMRDRQTPADLTPIALEVLLSLADAPRHGYGIKLDIEERTAGELVLGSGTLYQAVQRLERDGLIAGSAPARGDADPRRGRLYSLEPEGRAALVAQLRRLERSVAFARRRKLLPSERSQS
jgi:DNA-binding PadR family transcriptional regulator